MEAVYFHEALNKGKLIGQELPLKRKDIRAIRIHLQRDHCIRDLALFNLAIDSNLRGCDLVNLRIRDIVHGNQIHTFRIRSTLDNSVPSFATSANSCALGSGVSEWRLFSTILVQMNSFQLHIKEGRSEALHHADRPSRITFAQV